MQRTVDTTLGQRELAAAEARRASQPAFAAMIADAPQIDGSVYVSSRRPLKVGDIVNAKIDHADQYDLHGTVAGF